MNEEEQRQQQILEEERFYRRQQQILNMKEDERRILEQRLRQACLHYGKIMSYPVFLLSDAETFEVTEPAMSLF